MAFRLQKASLEAAVKHLVKYGDTDIFPHLPELAFFADEAAAADELSKLDLDSYLPDGALECLAPKSRYGFRLVHQLTAIDTVLMLACAIEIGPAIETRRTPFDQPEAFSYRFKLGASGQVFEEKRTFRTWLSAQKEIIENDENIAFVLHTDISDFYLRINFHRLENYLDECAPNHGAAKFLKKQIRQIRAKQSFGIPVGGSASRLLAELVLSDTDKALIDQGIVATRFVDDFRMFLGPQESPYDVLGYLAEQLGINEGLSLNVSKTEVLSRTEALERLEKQLVDVSDQANEDIDWESLTSTIYFDEQPSEEDIQQLKTVNLLSYLEQEVSAHHWDMGKIKVIFRALKIIQPSDAIDYIKQNFDALVPFSKELTLLMQVLEQANPHCFDSLLDAVIDAILRPPASSVQVIRTWLMELFVRGVINIPASKLKRIESLSGPIDRRQLFLIRGRMGDKNFFRKNKTAFHQFASSEQPYLMWGAACLPEDEFENWITFVGPKNKSPLGGPYGKWLIKNRATLNDRLIGKFDEHPE